MDYVVLLGYSKRKQMHILIVMIVMKKKKIFSLNFKYSKGRLSLCQHAFC